MIVVENDQSALLTPIFYDNLFFLVRRSFMNILLSVVQLLDSIFTFSFFALYALIRSLLISIVSNLATLIGFLLSDSVILFASDTVAVMTLTRSHILLVYSEPFKVLCILMLFKAIRLKPSFKALYCYFVQLILEYNALLPLLVLINLKRSSKRFIRFAIATHLGLITLIELSRYFGNKNYIDNEPIKR
ncbi:Uncharacterized protein FWK35_00030404 [Aphis craccivora]|uniref:Uncharacterized protein n=1 Tax=Aphis craccivora TaxID=307492 RepID=A0A6G0YMQ5_APHCR|nr:Uncharacterized protein FWK35_00030404 [Aphis craccivora]